MCESRDIIFVHSSRSPEDFIFGQELRLIASRHRDFRAGLVCSNQGQRGDYTGIVGKFSETLLEVFAPDFMEREIFACGPDSYMHMVREILECADFDLSHFHQESFSFETLARDEPAVIKDVIAQELSFIQQEQSCTVEFSLSSQVLKCGRDQYVLNAAQKAGLHLPASCTRGVCGTCKAKLISGEVDMQHGGGIRKREIEQGMILLCCSKPLSDLVIER
jgi:glycine betaine catabolism B